VGQYAEVIGSEMLLLLAAGSILPAALCSELSYRWGGEPAPSEEERGLKSLALSLFKESSYLRRLGFLIVFTQFVSATFELRLLGLLEHNIIDLNARTAYMGRLYLRINFSAGTLQFIIAPIILYYISVKYIHLGIPIVHMAAAGILLVRPSLFTGSLAYFLFKSFDYSIFRASKETFYIPLSFDCRYRAKEVIDSFGYRAAKGGVAGLFSLAVRVFGAISGVVYPAVALVSACAWTLTVKGLVRQYDNMLKEKYTNSGEQEI
jgi:ATP/ADP translocase